MKLSQVDENVLTTLFGKEVVDKISGALKSDDGELTLGARINGRVITQDEEAALKTTATDAGVEIGYKKVAKAAGLDLSAGEKDAKVIADKITQGITTGLEEKYKGQTPTDELIAAQAKIKEAEDRYIKLNETYEGTLNKVTELEGNYTGLQQEIQQKENNNSILKSFPEKMSFSRDHALLIINNTLSKEDVDGKTIYKRDGQTLTDQVGNPLAIDKIVPSLVEEFGWIKSEGMNGGDRSSSNVKTGLSAEEAERAIVEAGKDPGSAEGLKMFNEMTQ
jgi:hypothetical protein